MRPRSLIISVLFLLGLIALQPALAAVPKPGLPRADLVVVLNSTPANPLGGEIWLMDLNGKPVRRITQNNDHEEYPSFSPDGSKIAFVRNLGESLDPKNNEIFVYDLRTGTETRLTRNNVEDSHPEWSFDGKYIAFHSRRDHPEGKATLWTMEADGSDPRLITPLLPGDLSHLHPNWGPDGQWVAFVNYREENGHRYARIEKVRRDGSQRTVVSSGGKYLNASVPGKQELLGDLEPAYSPDGAMIWAARPLKDGLTHLFSFGAGAYYGGKAEKDMDWTVHPGEVEQSPRFSPDGRRILLTRLSPRAGIGRRQVILTDPQSSFRRYLTSREDWDAWHPNWHPYAHSGAEREDDGKRVSYDAGPEAKALLAKNGDGQTSNRGPPEPSGIRLAATVEPAGLRAAPAASYEARWRLNLRPENVSSLTFRYQGKLAGEDESEKRSLGFQLMDWDSKSWVTVFVRSGILAEAVNVQHEIAPQNFISRDSHEVALRIVARGSSAGLSPALEIRQLLLDVKHH